MKNVEIYTYGGCRKNTSNGVIGGVLVYSEKNAKKEFSEYYGETSNMEMSLYSIVKGLRLLKEPCRVKIYNNSNEIIAILQKNQKIEGLESLQKYIDELTKIHKISFHDLKNSPGNPFNCRTDLLVERALNIKLYAFLDS